ncbi:MAG: carboxypeptidase-like regulatory domain-containing protein [Planctomycetes bacterium]|jgi:hypothetical protein|nr:carboxypeptidase-like regulatory domain-containing protein [Planctomycetota bacterium]
MRKFLLVAALAAVTVVGLVLLTREPGPMPPASASASGAVATEREQPTSTVIATAALAEGVGQGRTEATSGLLRVEVVDEVGVPLADVELVALGAVGSAVSSQRTTVTGVCSLACGDAAEVVVLASHADYLPATSGAVRPVETAGLRVVMRSGLELRGICVTTEGAPVPDAQVVVRNASSDPARSWLRPRIAVAAADGTFVVRGCADVDYKLSVQHSQLVLADGIVYARPGQHCKVVMHAARFVCLQWQAASGERLVPSGDVAIGGSKVDFVAAAEVVRQVVDSCQSETVLRAGCGGLLPVPVDERSVSAGGEPTVELRASLHGCEPLQQRVRCWTLDDLRAARCIPDLVVLTLAAPTSLWRLHARYEDGSPLPAGTPISVHAPAGPWLAGSVVGEGGSGVAPLVLAAGRYRVRVGFDYQVFGESELVLDGAGTDLEVRVPRGADIVFTVAAAEGGLAWPLQARLRRVDGDAAFDSGPFVVRGVGAVVWNDLPAGDYRVIHEGVQGRWRSGELRLTVGSQATWELPRP